MVSGLQQFSASKYLPLLPDQYLKPLHSSFIPFGQEFWTQLKVQISLWEALSFTSHLHSAVNSNPDFVGYKRNLASLPFWCVHIQSST